jgi:anti-sigma B factor antagonist
MLELRSAECLAIITLSGELDILNAAEIIDRVDVLSAIEGLGDIHVDLAGVTFLDSTALGSLIASRALCAERGVRLALRDPSAVVRRLLAVTGTDEIFAVVHDRAPVASMAMTAARPGDAVRPWQPALVESRAASVGGAF